MESKLLWEVEGPGYWFQRTNIMAMLQGEELKIAGMDAFFCCFLALCRS